MSQKENETVAPLPGLAPWVGGKRNLAKRLVARIDATDHVCYAEPFIGMGGVFFRRTRPAAVEVVNDRSGEVVNLFRVVKNHAEAFLGEMDFQPHARAEFHRLLKVDPSTLTDIQRAARFFYIMRSNYGGIPDNRSFPTAALRSRALPRNRIRQQMTRTAERLATVIIENLDYQEFIRRYDRATTLFYLDPPYWGCEDYYGKGLFERADFELLSERLRHLTGRFILSINDVPEIRQMFAWAKIEEEQMTYKVRGSKSVTELVISGGGSGRASAPGMPGS